MEIVIAHSAAPGTQNMGGVVRYVMNLLKFLVEKRIKSTFIGIRYRDIPFERPKYAFRAVLKGNRRRIDKALWFRFDMMLFFHLLNFKISKKAIIQTGRLDIMAPFVFLFPKNPKIMISDSPLIGYAKPTLGRFFPLFERFYRIIEAYCLRRIDYLITDNMTKRHFELRYPWINEKLIIMSHSTVDSKRFRPMDRNKLRLQMGLDLNQKIVLFIGRIEPIKNLPLLINAFEKFLKRNSNACLLILGSGSEKDRISKLASEILPEDSFRFLGEIMNDEIPKWINCCNIVVLSSLSEGSPTVVKEALACGVPVVSTDVGDVATIINNEKLGKVVPHDEGKFADALEEVVKTQSQEPEAVKRFCLSAVQPHCADAFGERMLDVYRTALEKRGYV